MKINLHAGHNPDGKTACGAVGLIKESTEARLVKNEVIALLRQEGHTVYDCTCDNGMSQADVLSKIVAKCNENAVDLDVSIHFNSGVNDREGNGKTTGTEVYVYGEKSGAKEAAKRVCAEIANLGFQNRGVKYSTSLYVLRRTDSPAMLIECCFVDDADDVKRYNCQDMALAIAQGLIGGQIAAPQAAEGADIDQEAEALGAETASGSAERLYRVQVGAYSKKENAERQMEELRDKGYGAFITSA